MFSRVTVGEPRRSEQSSDKSNRKRKIRSRDTEEEYLSYRMAGESRRDGGHFEVFFTAINNPERTSFRELTQARGRIEACRDSSSFMPLSTLLFLLIARSYILLLLSRLQAALFVKQYLPGSSVHRGGYKGTYTTYFETRKNNVSSLVGQTIGRSRLRVTHARVPKTLDFRCTSPLSRKPRRSMIYSKWSTVSTTKRSDKKDEIYIR